MRMISLPSAPEFWPPWRWERIHLYGLDGFLSKDQDRAEDAAAAEECRRAAAKKVAIRMMPMSEVEKEKGPGYRQCIAKYAGRNKADNLTMAWCQRRRGHQGDHRGYRAQWPQEEPIGGQRRLP